MTPIPDGHWSFDYLLLQVDYIRQVFHSKTFRLKAPFTDQSQLRWLELINLVDELLQQAWLAGQRIDFTDEVDQRDPAVDITTLLTRMRSSAYPIGCAKFTETNILLIRPDLNHHYGAGVGYFRNGLFFNCPYPEELAFFVGADRVLFYRHLMRAFIEARHYLLASYNAS